MPALIDFADATFDYVVGNDILHHLSRNDVVESLAATHRVLKPGGVALFNEPIENSRTFDFIQNLFPVGAPDSPHYRPSILHRQMWQTYLANVDDRALSDAELAAAKGPFRMVEFHYCGLLIRLERWLTNAILCRMLDQIDRCITHRYSPLKRLSRSVLAIYKK
ncbi:MAG: class I SAM-dependent methyltransferase [Caldilineaceae bacterium]